MASNEQPKTHKSDAGPQWPFDEGMDQALAP